jgi:hypothetical protein
MASVDVRDVQTLLANIRTVDGRRIAVKGRLIFSADTAALCAVGADVARVDSEGSSQCLYLDFGDDPRPERLQEFQRISGRIVVLEGDIVAGKNGREGGFPARLERIGCAHQE